eukprot:TRINITY_DN2427_c0_g2_i3.p1 TRINITY_DN2427_c0_g2~~TRINITY_DN2427_c0_g2_i3.p1  ORF type:complete len:517 (+),score=86.06 TRINITY_DN2427_c0_g2_i3:233-1783(+)
MMLGCGRSRKALLQLGQQVRLVSTDLAKTSVQTQPVALPGPDPKEYTRKGFLQSLFGTGNPSRITVVPSEELPGVVIPSSFTPAVQTPPTQITTLPNGFRIASEDTWGPSASMGLYVSSGSIYETPDNTGITHLMEYMAFKGTMHRTHFRVVQEITSIGANTIAAASRDQIAYNIECVKVHIPHALEILCDTVFQPELNKWETEDSLMKCRDDVYKIYESNPVAVLTEELHAAAYRGPLGRPFMCPKDATYNFNTVREYFNQNYSPDRMVLAGAGIPHDQLVELVSPMANTLSAPLEKVQVAGSEYVGGEVRTSASGGLAHGVLAFECEGWKNFKATVINTVIQFLLGGGGSFSSGGPGKGIHSRLYVQVLARYDWMENCTSFSHVYDDTGLLGIQCSGNPFKAAEMVDVMCQEMTKLATTPPSTEEVERAKKAATSTVVSALENKSIVAEDIGRSLLTYGKRNSIEEIIEEINKITPADIQKTITTMMKKPPTLGIYSSEMNQVPRYHQILSRFG